MNLNRDLREFVELLNATEVKWLLVGGHAVAFHGYPRFTGDIDFFVEPVLENGGKLVRVFSLFGFGDLGFTAADFTAPGTVIQLGRPPNRIDILPTIDGVNFEEAWRTKIETSVDGLALHVISKEMLIRNKSTTGRLQDLADIEKLR
jgi:hypothetical protein